MPLSRTIAENNSGVVTFTILVDGTDIGRNYNITSIVINREINKIAWAKIVLSDGNPAEEQFPVSNEETFIPGKEIEIQAGYNSENNTIYKGLVSKHGIKIRNNASSQLIIDCRDTCSKLTLNKKNKYFLESKDSDIIQEIVDTYGLTADIEATDVQHKEVVQYNATDWDFIVTRAEANGKLCFTDDGKLVITKPDFSQPTKFDVLYGATILEFDAEIDARYQYQGVESKSWSYADQELKSSSASDPSVTELGNLSSSDLSSLFYSENTILNHGGSVDESQLQAWADAYLLKSRLAKIRGRVKFQGHFDIKPFEFINLGGISDRFNGKLFVSGVHHEIISGNWTTDIQFGLSPKWFAEETGIENKNTASLIPAINGLHIGVVTDLEDPENEFRVCIKIPSISMDENGIWARIATLDAGDTRGTFFRPELNDEVVAGFFDNDPRHPVILGMLNSSAKAAGLTPANDNHEKGYISRSGMKLIFNDDEKSIKLETPAGKKITVDEQNALMSMEDENGNSVKFEASGITIESSANITLKAGATLTLGGAQIAISGDGSVKVEASGSMEVSSSGTTTIKGSLVQIN